MLSTQAATDAASLGGSWDPETQFPYPALKIYRQGAQLVIQPANPAAPGAPIETLQVDLKTGAVSLSHQPGPPAAPATDVLGLLGLCKLQQGVSLVAITGARRVACVKGADVYELQDAQVISDKDAALNKDNKAILNLLKDAVDPSSSGRGVYFSHFYDLTHSLQRQDSLTASAQPPNTSVARRADPRFFYSRHLAQPLLDVRADRFVVSSILGFVRQLPDLNFSSKGATTLATLTLIARRGVDRAGTRQWRRGVDKSGHVANFVETEQMLATPQAQASFVEVRGSIPLLWTQLPNIKYKPTTVIGVAGQSSPMFDAHMSSLQQNYKDVIAVNLINHKGTEGKLEVAFRQEAQRYCAQPASSLRYLAFDFHHECSKGRYHRLSLLWDKVRDDLQRHGYFLSKDGRTIKRQNGVVRTNCIDCLDRTNVVQGVLARKALEAMLVDLSLMDPAATLPQAFPAVEQAFKIMWADHGDAVSGQYAGTGAMKSGFTRTGKRTFMGVLDDGYKAVARYYLNNFQDGKKQDAVDLFTGAYKVMENAPVPLRAQPSPLIPLGLAMVAIAYGAGQLGNLVTGGLDALATRTCTIPANAAEVAACSPQDSASALQVLLVQVALPLLLGVGLFAFIVQNGKHLVNKPLLCPHLAVTVAKPKTKGR